MLRLHNLRILLLALFLVACSISSLSQSHSVALTFDDLPVVGEDDPAVAQSITSTILKALDAHHAPAIGFVIGRRAEDLGKNEGRQLLKQWVKHGYPLGNHTFSHPDSNALTVQEFEQDIIANEKILNGVQSASGGSPRYFRFPFNHTGDTQEKQDAFAAFLKQRGYQLAACTIDNEDYIFNRAYLRLLAQKDTEAARRVRAEYLAYTATEIDYYNNLHMQVFGREIPQVMLLHVNRLNADVIEQVLAIFEQKQYRFVNLATAQTDPAYQTPDTFVTKEGFMWGYRWAKVRGVKVNGNLETEPPDWIFRYAQQPPTQ